MFGRMTGLCLSICLFWSGSVRYSRVTHKEMTTFAIARSFDHVRLPLSALLSKLCRVRQRAFPDGTWRAEYVYSGWCSKLAFLYWLLQMDFFGFGWSFDMVFCLVFGLSTWVPLELLLFLRFDGLSAFLEVTWDCFFMVRRATSFLCADCTTATVWEIVHFRLRRWDWQYESFHTLCLLVFSGTSNWQVTKLRPLLMWRACWGLPASTQRAASFGWTRTSYFYVRCSRQIQATKNCGLEQVLAKY